MKQVGPKTISFLAKNVVSIKNKPRSYTLTNVPFSRTRNAVINTFAEIRIALENTIVRVYIVVQFHTRDLHFERASHPKLRSCFNDEVKLIAKEHQ